MKQKYRWEDVGDNEFFETTTEAMQYHFSKTCRYLESAERLIEAGWVGEIYVNDAWQYIGLFTTRSDAKAAVISAYELAI
jgi:hypothetical protein